MFGHLFVLFRPQDIGIEPEAIPKKDRDGEWGQARRTEVADLLRPTPLTWFTVADNYSQDNYLTYDGDSFVARLRLQLDPRSGRLFQESRPYVGKEHTVELYGWVSVDRARSERLACGPWHNADRTVGVTVINDPSKDDRSRMSVYVIAPTIAQAREAFVATLEGTNRSEKPWIV